MDIISASPEGRKKRSANANAEQKRLLVQFVRERPNLLSGKFTSTFTKESCKKLWQEASTLLNAVPGGGFKDWKQWRKTWQDLKTRTKVKEAAVRKYRNETGGGPQMPPPTLKPEEEVAVEALTKVSIEGHDDVCESLMELDIEIAENFDEQSDPLPAQSSSPLQLILSPPEPLTSPTRNPTIPTPIAECSINDFFPTAECASRPLLDPKAHARIEITSISSNMVEVGCQGNYQDVLAPCQTSKFYCKRGKWVGVYPHCVEAHMCRAPPEVPYSMAINRNFEISYDSERVPFYPINAQITYECLKGYMLDGSAVINCQVNGCWEPSSFWPTCIRTKDNYFIELTNINAILISSATGAGVLGILLLACLVVACKKRKALARAVALPSSTAGSTRHAPDVVNDHAVLLQHPDRLALIAFAEGVQNTQNNSLPSYDEATRDRSTLIQVSRLQIQRPHWPNLTVCRASGRNRGSPNIDSGHHVPRHGSFVSHTPSVRSGGESMGSTETVTISEGSTNVTLDTASSHSAVSQNPSCRGHCGSLASFDGCSIANTEGIPLLEESELEEIQGGTNDIDNPMVSDNASSKISTHSAPMLSN